jgi:hypothetical protein
MINRKEQACAILDRQVLRCLLSLVCVVSHVILKSFSSRAVDSIVSMSEAMKIFAVMYDGDRSIILEDVHDRVIKKQVEKETEKCGLNVSFSVYQI